MTKGILGLLGTLVCVSCYGPPEPSSREAVPVGTVSQSLYESDNSNCGALGYACANGRTCSSSRCSPAWQTISAMNAPASRAAAAAAALGGSYVVTGGCTSTEAGYAEVTGGSYNPSNNTWSSIDDLSEGRAQHAAASNGSNMYVFSGLYYCWTGNTFGPGMEKLASLGGSWSSVTVDEGVELRYNASMVYATTGVFIYGGSSESSYAISGGATLTTGLIPGWLDVSCSLGGCARGGAYAAFQDSLFIRVLGNTALGGSGSGFKQDILFGTWSSWTVPTTNEPYFFAENDVTTPVRYADGSGRVHFLGPDGSVYTYKKSNATWSVDTASEPSGFCPDAATAWVGSELIAWGGLCDNAISSVGGRYQPPAP